MKILPMADTSSNSYIHSDTSSNSDIHFFNSSLGTHLFIADGSKIYDIKDGKDHFFYSDDYKFPKEFFVNIATKNTQYKKIDKNNPISPPPLFSLSLNVAQSCNMSCGYCYADEGKFGGNSRMMSFEVAKSCVDRLIKESSPGSDLVIGFMGGEPLLNRKVIYETTKYAVYESQKTNHKIRFSITTNGTLIKPEDAKLFTDFPFTVTMSIDGINDTHNSVRKMNDGSNGYNRVMEGLDTLEKHGRPNYLSARVTVTPRTGKLLPIIEKLLNLGFDDVGFSPVLVSPIPSLAFSQEEFSLFLEQMIVCGKKALNEILNGRQYHFSNFETALLEIHKGTHRPYPCGAGAAYLSANAEGYLFACHRLVDDPKFAMGSVRDGLDDIARSRHLINSHVDKMEPCNKCWARYLCGGGCYHEVTRRGRIACDYIRGWLDFCLKSYVEVSSCRPKYFQNLSVYGGGDNNQQYVY